MTTGLCYVLQSMSQNTASAILAETISSLVKQLLTLRTPFFQCSLSQGYATLNRGSSGLWVYGSVLFHHKVSGGRGMTFFRPCTRIKVRVTLDASVQEWRIFRLRTQPGALSLHELATIFLFSSPSVIELSILTCTGTTTMFECLDMDFCKTTCSGLLC